MDSKTYLLISVLEAVYVVYMLCFFKTRYSFEFQRPLVVLNFIGSKLGIYSKYLEHNMSQTINPISHICPFGHWSSWILGFYLIARNYSKLLRKYNPGFIILVGLISLLNYNAVVYLLPIFILEFAMFLHFKRD